VRIIQKKHQNMMTSVGKGERGKLVDHSSSGKGGERREKEGELVKQKRNQGVVRKKDKHRGAELEQV
jgi:hypothetical protein